MALTKQEMLDIVASFGNHPHDVGATEVQVAALTQKLKVLTDHMQQHNKDFVTRRAILKMVADRRKLLAYLKRVNEPRYSEVKEKLGLK